MTKQAAYLRSPCSIGIFTTGNLWTISFANEPHVDSGDTFTTEQTEEILLNLENAVMLTTKLGDHWNDLKANAYLFLQYIRKFVGTLKLGVPTTCAYQHVKLDEELTFLQYFVMEGLGCSVFLEDFIGHNFIGHAFVHNTSLCLAIDKEGRVWMDNDNGKIIGYIFGWGGAGNGCKKSDDIHFN